MYDLLIKNGTVIDGSGQPAYAADVAVENGKIAAIAPEISEGLARETIDVKGLSVIPGIIDMHSHADLSFLDDERCQSKLYQGVTSELSGQCGSTAYPCPPEHLDRIEAYGRTSRGNFAAASLEAFAKGVEQRGDKMGTNQLPLIGHGVLRCGVMGYEDRTAGSHELEQMRRLLRADMEYGAWGLSLGLGYTPGLSSDTEELCRLGEEVAPFGGIVTSHMRNQSTGTPQALEEMYEIYRRSGAHVHIAHFKASGAAQGRASEYIQNVHDAQKSGVNVTVDFYPYTAASSGVTNSFPKWSIQGGTHRAVEILTGGGPDRERLMDALRSSFATQRQAESLLVSSTGGRLPEADGRTIWEISQLWGCTPADAVARLCVETNAGSACISFSMSQSDVDLMLRQNDFSVGSDGSALPLDPALNRGKPHPRNFGTFPRFLRLAREQGFCTPEVAVRRITGLTADTIGIKDRGYLRPGLVADIAVIDLNTVTDTATYQDPVRKPVGVVHVLMDGRFALRDGEQTEERLGKLLLRK